jgi:uncharacterized protein
MILPIIVRACPLGPVPERAFAPAGEKRAAGRPLPLVTAARLRSLPRRRVCGRVVPVASGFRSRLLGLAGLSREQIGAGLMIPRCACVHTFGMRVPLDVIFLDRRRRPLAVHGAVPARPPLWRRGADAVLELPAGEGGEFDPPAA